MSILRRLWLQDRGSSFESFALVLSVIAVLSVGAADLLHYSTKKDGVIARFVAGVRTQVAELGHNSAAHNNVDYAPTGSIIGLRRGTTLNPCSTADYK